MESGMIQKNNPNNTPKKDLPSLFFIMERLVSLHRHLLDVLDEEYAHMIGVDANGLLETSKTKEVLVGEIMNSERLRIQTADAVARTLGFNFSGVNGVTLAELSSRLQKIDAEKLQNYKNVLQLLMVRAKESNSRNMVFVENSLVHIETMKKNILGLNNTSNENYGNTGERAPLDEQGGRLLSVEA